jgi:hypothetical protein
MDFIKAAFPDFTNTIEEVVSEGERSFTRLSHGYREIESRAEESPGGKRFQVQTFRAQAVTSQKPWAILSWSLKAGLQPGVIEKLPQAPIRIGPDY